MSSTKLKQPFQISAFLRRWWTVLLLPVAAVLVAVAKQNPQLTERYYSEGVYRLFAGVIGAFTSLIPFSIAELAICTLIVAGLVLIVIGIVHAVKAVRGSASKKKTNWKAALERIVKLVSVLVFLFVLLCGLNYYRPEFTTFSGLTIRDSPIQELEALCTELALEANALREGLPEDDRQVMQLSASKWETAKIARETFGLLADEYDVLPDLAITPKPVVNSWWMSLMQITGVFSAFTYEANINIAAPEYSIPSTMCHELAHTRGFMREDEANFIGYLACRKSVSDEFQYSGTMLALIHSINRLYEVDKDAYFRVNAVLSDGVRRDLAANNEYWAKREGPVSKVSTAVNNTYLKINNQSDGVQSYGRMVDLLLADYRQRYGLE